MTDPDEILRHLPRYAKDYTPEQREACVEWLSRLPLPELRQRQSLMNEQIGMAYRQATAAHPPLHAPATLEDLQEKSQQLTDAVSRWLDRRNGDR